MNLQKRIKLSMTVITVLTLILIFSSTNASAKSNFFKKFETDYKTIDIDLLRHEIEEMDVEDFTYQKDLATFYFKSGKMYLLRYIDGRPTTAVFIGEGHAKISIPSHAERMTLMGIAKDSVIDESFKICFIRMADDFDLRLKEKFSTVRKKLKWKDFQQVKKSQGEFLFKPNIFHTYDNFFQLARSLYTRELDGDNGYFWIDFNRYNFTYDPSRPEAIIIGYEFEINDMEITDAVYLKSHLQNEIDTKSLSDITFPTIPISHEIYLTMAGLDGKKLESAQTNFKLVVNADSLKFVSTFLHYNLKLDSIYLNGSPVDYHRRKDFKFIGIILPEYFHKGDTLNLTYWYYGKNFDYLMPYVENRQATDHSLHFTIPRGYNYLMPGMGDLAKADKGTDTFSVFPQQPLSEFYFQGYATNYDTLSKISELGMQINFIKSKAIKKGVSCFIPDEIYETSMMDAVNFMSSKVGAPIGTFSINVFPENFMSMPGLVEMPQVLCYNPGYSEPLGGFDKLAGHAMAKQWFGHLLKPYSTREAWLKRSAAEYLSLLFVESKSSTAYYTNMKLHQDSLYKFDQQKMTRPLYANKRAGEIINTNKGIWFFHMLRMVMLDLETGSNQNFTKFFYRLAMLSNGKIFTNEDIIKLAEKYHGADLRWFFDQWLFNYTVPTFDVTYRIYKEGAEYFISVEVDASGVDKNFSHPMIMNIKDSNGEANLKRVQISGEHTSLSFGPFTDKPSGFVFNELFSVLSNDNVVKK